MTARTPYFDFAADLARVQAAAFTPAVLVAGIGSTPQQDLFDAQVERDRILAAHAERRKELLAVVHDRLVVLAVAHAHHLVTADDASRILSQMPEAAGLDPRFLGAVWRQDRRWRKTGDYVPSYRRHGAMIPVWRWEGV